MVEKFKEPVGCFYAARKDKDETVSAASGNPPISKAPKKKKKRLILKNRDGERNHSDLTLKTIALIEKELRNEGKLHLGTLLVTEYVQVKCEEKMMEMVAEVLKELETISIPEFNQLYPDLFQEVMEVVNSLLDQLDQ